MLPAELLLWGLIGWTAIGLVGSLLSGVRRGDSRKARRGVLWILSIWTAYLLVLVSVSRFSAQKSLPLRQAQCFGHLCFAVEGIEQLTTFAGRGQPGDRLLRVRIRVTNRGHTGREQDGDVRAYLLDSHGGRWLAVRGLTGVPLSSPVPAAGELLSEPVFSVPERVGPVQLVLTHGQWQPGALVIGDGDSLLHRPVTMDLNSR